MKRILFLFLPFLPCLASAQVAKDTVTVLTLAQIPAGAIRDTTNLTFVQDNAFAKATFDSLAKYTRVKLIGDRGDITVSGSTGLTWELDAGVVDSMQLSAGAVVLPGAKVTGTLPVSKGGTGTPTQFTAGSVVFAGASGVYSQDNTGLFWDNTNKRIYLNSSALGTVKEGTLAPMVVQSASSGRAFCAIGRASANLTTYLFFQNNADSVMFGFDVRDTYSGIVSWRNAPLRFRTAASSIGAVTTRMAITGAGEVGIGTESPAVQFHTTGGVRFAGLATSGTSTYTVKADATGNLWYDSSDESYKKNISAIPYGIAAVMQLNPVAYNFVEDDEPDLGFIAQDIYNIIPELTYTAQDGKFGVKYDKIVSVLTKAIQEQQAQIEALKARITQLENK